MIHAAASATAAWDALRERSRVTREAPIAALFTADARRCEWAQVRAEGLVLDFTRQRIDAATFALLTQLAEQLDLRERIRAMYRGDVLNVTEGRAVLHTALRRPGAPYATEVAAERERMLDFAEGVRGGGIRGSAGDAFDLVVNIGIGGSDLGPAMAVEALHEYSVGAPRIAFVSNVDGCRLADVLEKPTPPVRSSSSARRRCRRSRRR